MRVVLGESGSAVRVVLLASDADALRRLLVECELLRVVRVDDD